MDIKWTCQVCMYVMYEHISISNEHVSIQYKYASYTCKYSMYVHVWNGLN